MIPLSVAIMGIPERTKNIFHLKNYFESHSIPTKVFIDSDHKGIWWNSKRCWQSATGDYHLVIQDDTHICNENAFIPTLFAQIDFIRNNSDKYILNLFSPYGRQNDIEKVKNGLLIYPRSGNAVAIVMSRINITKMLLFLNKYIPDTESPHLDDERIGAWQHFSKIKTLCPVPMLIYHGDDAESTTYWGIKNKNRRMAMTSYLKNNSFLNFDGIPINTTNIIKAKSWGMYTGFRKYFNHG